MNSELKKFIQEKVKKLHRLTMLEEQKKEIEADLKLLAESKTTDKWIQKAVDPEHKGYCTPMTKATCTPKRKALAKRFKKGIDEELDSKEESTLVDKSKKDKE